MNFFGNTRYVLLLAVSLLAPTSCDAMTSTRAERCVYVDLQARQGLELLPLLDEFAESTGLVADKSHPINPRYARRSRSGDSEAEVSYRIGMGEFGAELALFRYEVGVNAELVERFDRFVAETVAAKYGITPCRPEQFPTSVR